MNIIYPFHKKDLCGLNMFDTFGAVIQITAHTMNICKLYSLITQAYLIESIFIISLHSSMSDNQKDTSDKQEKYKDLDYCDYMPFEEAVNRFWERMEQLDPNGRDTLDKEYNRFLKNFNQEREEIMRSNYNNYNNSNH